MSKAKAITDATFDAEVLQSQTPVLVDFWAPWCGPCKRLSPTIDELAGELEGRVKVVKADVGEAQLKAREYGVQSIPTLFVVKGGKVVDKAQGLQSKDALANMIKKHL